MTSKTDAEEAAETLGCAALVAFLVASLVGCIGLGVMLGAGWGFAGVALVIASVGVLMVLAAKNAKRKMEDGRKADEK